MGPSTRSLSPNPQRVRRKSLVKVCKCAISARTNSSRDQSWDGCTHDSAFRYDDDAVADVPAVTVRGLHVVGIRQHDFVRDARVLIDDHAVEDDVAADADLDVARCGLLLLVEVGAEQQRPPDRRAALDVRADTDDRVLDGGLVVNVRTWAQASGPPSFSAT